MPIKTPGTGGFTNPGLVNPKSTASSVGGGGGGGGSASGGGTIEPEIRVESVETAISAEVPITLTANQAAQIKWNKYGSAGGYRIFLYKKDAQGQPTSSFYKDVDRTQLSLLWAHDEGRIAGDPSLKNDFHQIAVGTVRHKVDINGSSTTTQKLGSYVKDLLKAIGGKTDAELDLPSFAAIDSEFPEEVQRYIGNQEAIGTLVNEAELSCLGYLKPNDDGKIGFYLTDPTKAPAASFTEIDYVNPALTSRHERARTYKEIVIGFGHDPIDGSFETVKVDIDEATYKWVTNEIFEVSSILIDKSANRRMALLWAANLKQQQLQIVLSVRSKGFVVSVGDVISVTKARGFAGGDGTYSDERWIVYNISRNLESAVASFLGIQPFRETEKIKVWAPDTVPAWGSASAAEKQTYGFWADDNSLVDTQYRQSVWGLR